MSQQKLIASFSEIVYILKLGLINVELWLSEHNSVTKILSQGSISGQLVGQKSASSWVYNFVHKKWGHTEGQLISKCLLGVFQSTKKQQHFLKDFCPKGQIISKANFKVFI